MTDDAVAAKINLALLVGRLRADGYHPVATVLQRVDVCDRIVVSPAPTLEVRGFADDTLVRRALELLAGAAAAAPGFRVTLTKGIPVAAGLGGGSADAAAALLRGNALLPSPLPADRLHELARELGADVPFFLEPGPKLAEGVGELLSPLELPQDYAVLLARDVRALKPSTGEIYRRFDAQGGGAAFERRRDELRAALREVRRARDLALLPPNDLRDVSGAGGLVARLVELGAFRADVSGAGPTVYGLFGTRRAAQSAARALGRGVHATVTVPVW